MDEVVIKLPLRLMPRKFGAVLLSFFFLFFFGFSVFWTVMAAMGVMTGGMEDEPFPGFRYAFPAFGIPFMAVGFVGLSTGLMKLLPGSPYWHVEIAPQGIKVRRGFRLRQFAWSEISPFGISARTKSTKGGKVTTYWVVALRAGDESYLSDEKQRYNRSVLQIDAGEYTQDKAEDAATALADWLNGIRAEAIDRPGRAATTTAVPPDFRGAVREIAAGAPRNLTKPSSRSSVIER
ncbi:hypothetical protein [Dongia sp.]|uniref:hypothetical protein n=1 Tax=Dongia sp. TaxID=1977262 RepID=UPI0037517131